MTTKERQRKGFMLNGLPCHLCGQEPGPAGVPQSLHRCTDWAKEQPRVIRRLDKLLGKHRESVPTPGIGPARKAAAHAHFEEVARGWLAKARAFARRKCQETGSVTSDDVRDAVGDPPEGISHNAIGALFMDGSFKPIGWTASKRPSSNGRSIRRWALRS